ncbi:MAG: SDR family NAD(P)-dependent oxidoreductase [Proteobacteria bacterium]|nr:SDR family NAD(P)-dependent oxidoreductase [Pseudomonadota bacterium]
MKPDSPHDAKLSPAPEGDVRKPESLTSSPPIAIVGMACRFPGAPDLAAFWHLLDSGGNAITQAEPGTGVDRVDALFPDDAVRSPACQFGGFVEDIDRFDAAFFRISPVEAQMLDPQQRMMLETSWHALEDAGIDPGCLKGSRTGVYTGISTDEYRMMVLDSARPEEAAGCLYALSGTNMNGAAGRVSFILGLMGPAKAVDAACASSLVSVHDAVADLQQGKADLAIAGGVHTMLNGRVYELRADSMMLSPDGQCKAFDASANGYVRGEGCGVVILKRLSEAQADGDRIWAVIRGAAVNHGGASSGLTVPNTPALEAVIEAALSHAGMSASMVDYLEAHGTGTTVGDPIELNAAAVAYGQGRRDDRPLLVGSVKTNIGHLEAAAGVAGLIKAALVVHRGMIPMHLHFHNPNPSLDWDHLPLRVITDNLPWPYATDEPRRAGVNSFGISGTNAHIILEQHRASPAMPESAPQPVGPAQAVATTLPQTVPECRDQAFVKRTLRLLPLSAKSEPALHALAERYLSWLDQQQAAQPDSVMEDEQLANLAWTASIGRSHFDYRAGLAFTDVTSLQQQLKKVAKADGLAHARSLKVAFAYTGQGSQWPGMGQVLYEREPVVRAVLDRCESVFFEQRGALLLDVMFNRPGARGALEDTAWEQPALYALECALTALWASLGVRPAVVFGHSVGELAAAQAAGVFSLEDGMRFAEARGRLLSGTAEGAMAAVFAPAQQVASAVAQRNKETDQDALCISGYNGLHQVISGPVPEVQCLLERFDSEGIRTRRLNTSRAFHSALVEPVLDDLEASLEGVAFESPSVKVISNLTGEAVGSGETLDAKYWRRHAREAVAFAEGIRTLSGLDVDLVVEIGPGKILAPMLASAWPDSAPAAPPGIPSLQAPSTAAAPEADPDAGFLQAVAKVYEAGLPVQFEGLFAGESRARISLPQYPFQRERHWMETPRRHRREKGHPLLGVRHESAAGGITYETQLYATDPAWLADHRVFERIVVPGAVYGAMAALASLVEGASHATVRDMQLHNAMIVPEADPDDDMEEPGATLQLVLGEEEVGARPVRVFSKGDEGDWILHAEARIGTDASAPQAPERIDLQALVENLSVMEVSDYYRARAETGIGLGPSFRTLTKIWAAPGEALAEVSVPEDLGDAGLGVHPLVLDGCFQVVGAARGLGGMQGSTTYLPFGWEQLWLAGPLPQKVFCHVRMNTVAAQSEATLAEAPEVQSGEVLIYDANGMLIGGLGGYTVKRAERSAMLSALEGTDDLLYEVVWRECALASGLEAADFFPEPASVKDRTRLFSEYLKDAGVGPEDRDALLSELEHWSWAYALANLDRLGWQRVAGETVDADALRQQLDVSEDHRRLFRRMLEMLTRCEVLKEVDDGFLVLSGSEDAWPGGLVEDPEAHAEKMAERFPHGLTEVGLFRRSGSALADVLRGQADPLTLLFSSGEPTAADLYLRAPVAQAANRMLGEAVRMLVAALPAGRRLRVIEVGAGTGSATASVLPELPQGQFEYTYTDISAGFFAEAEARFGDGGGHIDYRPLDIEKDPQDQGFEVYGYDLLIASNVLHATRLLPETLAHCLKLLAPSGQLIALENLRGQGWMDLTFGQLDGWWRFADDYRPHHALANPAVWRQALGDAGFDAIEILGVDESETAKLPDRGVIVARGPARVHEAPGMWILMADEGGTASHLAHELADRNQTVVLAGPGFDKAADFKISGPGVHEVYADAIRRESWQHLVEHLPGNLPFSGVVHFAGLDGHGMQADTAEIAEDVERAGASALALVQGVADSPREPAKGIWLITRGAQILERERGGELAGAILWGFGKAVDREAAHLCPRMIDLDPQPEASSPDLANELLYPDTENHIAYRSGRRQVARLVRFADGPARLALPKAPDWVLAPDPGGTFDRPCVQSLAARPLEPREVRVEVDAAGLNFWDVFRSLGFIEEGMLGREMCGRVIETGSEVSSVMTGTRVIGLGFGAFGPQMITREELVSAAPSGYSVTELATVPSAYVSAALSYELSGLQAGERVLIHAGAGGVGLAAIQLAQAAGAEVLATASLPKQAYLRSLGVEHLFDSRTTAFGEQILEVTGGTGVDVVLNSLTSEGFIDASLSCLRQGGRFVELARKDILSPEEMAAVRPDVGYDILELDVLKKTDPAWVGRVLDNVTGQLASGEIGPIVHSRWPLAEAGAALRFMRSARHLGKIVVTAPALSTGRLRQDATYLVTGGLGGIGIAVADWLVGQGAGTLVLNGRRSPDAEAESAIRELRERGASIHVEIADVTDAPAMDRMMSHIDQELPPLAGVIHSVGVLSDGALTNQNWERFEQVLGPKILGAWHLHRSTLDRDLDFFILFSSRVGVMGNPGQANHAAANAFLDQLAGHRRALGLAGQAIAWGAWSEIGEAAEQKDRIERQRSALGGRWFTPQQGLKALERLVRQDVTTSVVMSMDWSVFEKAVGARPPFLEEMLVTDDEAEAGAVASSADVMTRLQQTPTSERGRLLESYLQGEVQAVLRLPSAPEPAVGFFDLGMDSLMAVELRNRLNRAFSDEYTASNTVVFDYPDIISLARHLSEELGEVEEAPAPQVQPAPVSVSEDATIEGGIAIIGMACRFPGARNLSEFWQVLDEGRETVSNRREDTGLWDGVLGDPAKPDDGYQRGGFIEGIDRFDARFFGIRPIEAHAMDPQQRMLLETSWHALEDAGIDPERLRGSPTGVYAGIASSEYRDLMMDSGGPSYLGTAGSMAVGRVSFCLGLEGPTMPVMLNCASSLVAIHHAVASLHQGEVDLALAGGVNAILSNGLTRELAELGMLSRDGRCKTFNASADGFVRSEGCGMIVLKRLHEAQADCDRIWGVIRGSAINQSGASAGPTVPTGPTKERVIEEALTGACVLPHEVDYLEAHGGGSELGDSIEVNASARVYGRGREADDPLLIGSVKTNLGHLESAAGIAALIKTVLAMDRRRIPQHLHFHDPNPHTDWEQLPVKVVSEAMDWPRHEGRPTRAGVSAFGISGTNAHVVVEGYPGPEDASHPDRTRSFPAGNAQRVTPPASDASRKTPSEIPAPDLRKIRLLPLSGKSQVVLGELAEAYLAWLDAHSKELSDDDSASGPLLSDMAWTASTGRAHFDHRAGILFSDATSLRAQLQSLARGIGKGVPAAANADSRGVQTDEVHAFMLEVAEAYEAGRAVSLAGLFEGEMRQRISVPGYPFERKRFWVKA